MIEWNSSRRGKGTKIRWKKSDRPKDPDLSAFFLPWINYCSTHTVHNGRMPEKTNLNNTQSTLVLNIGTSNGLHMYSKGSRMDLKWISNRLQIGLAGTFNHIVTIFDQIFQFCYPFPLFYHLARSMYLLHFEHFETFLMQNLVQWYSTIVYRSAFKQAKTFFSSVWLGLNWLINQKIIWCISCFRYSKETGAK